MEKMKFIFAAAAVVIIIIYASPAFASQSKVSVTYDTLTIISYSQSYNSALLDEVYLELMRNFTGPEFPLLSKIVLLPENGQGVLGNYYEDIRVNENGKYEPGDEAYIEIYSCDRYLDEKGNLLVHKIAAVISHEYGHHYTLCNITAYEGMYYSRWAESEYASIRNLSQYSLTYNPMSGNEYSHAYDVAEIAANDYVQLLGSRNARRAYDYKDAAELVRENPVIRLNPPVCFNMRPQENTELPLAADVSGLYSYLLAVAGYTHEAPVILCRPEIVSISNSFGQYDVTWSAAYGAPDYEYTLVMYPVGEPSMLRAVKTVGTGEELRAVFGRAFHLRDDGTITVISDSFTGEYIFKVYALDGNGVAFSSPEFKYDFDSQASTSKITPEAKTPASLIRLTSRFIPPNPPHEAGRDFIVPSKAAVNRRITAFLAFMRNMEDYRISYSF